MNRAPVGSYLIAGRPRSRTAWLSALLYGALPCYHDDLRRLDGLVAAGTPFGFASPSLVVTDPARALELFSDCPIVIVDRDPHESWPALERWAGFPLPGWRELEDRYQWFLAHVPCSRLLTVRYEMLEHYSHANTVNSHCLGTPLCHDRFRAFSTLRVEQHREKAARNAPTDISLGRLQWRG